MSEKPTPVNRARELRQNMTGAESLLWLNLRNRRFMNLKFNRQHPIIYQMDQNEPKFFVADFYCHEKKLVLEIDGKIHDFLIEYDQHREDILKDRGFNILRLTNEEVENIPEVLKKIREYILVLNSPLDHLR